MALSRMQTEITYKSTADAGGEYYFTVVMDLAQALSVRDIRGPTGPIRDSATEIPKDVSVDMQTAIGNLEDLVAQTSATNGTLTFTAETSKAVVFATAYANTNYRVALETGDFIPVRVTTKTTTGFTVEAGITYTGSVGYDVFV
jgi:hypothetical protein